MGSFETCQSKREHPLESVASQPIGGLVLSFRHNTVASQEGVKRLSVLLESTSPIYSPVFVLFIR